MAYPTSIISFITHNTGDIVQPADVNTPDTEIVSIETGLLNGFQHTIFPLTDVLYDAGKSATRFRNFYSAALQALDIANRVNYLEIDAAATGNAANIKSTGSDATVNLTIGTKGGTQLKLVDGTSLVNFLQFAGTATGTDPTLSVQGDANRGCIINTKGTGILSTNTAFGATMPTPPTPTLTGSSTGGSLATNTYYIKATALDANGGESAASAEASVAITGPNGKITVSVVIPGLGNSSEQVITYRAYIGTSAGGENLYITSVTPTNQSLIFTTLTGLTTGTPPTTNTAQLNHIGAGTSWLSLAAPGSGKEAWGLHALKLSTDTVAGDGVGITAQFDNIAFPAAASTVNYTGVEITTGFDGSTGNFLSGAATYGIQMNINNGAAAGSTLGSLYGINMNIGANGAANVTTATGLQINRFAGDIATTTNIYGVHITDLAQAGNPLPTLAYGILFDSSGRPGAPYYPIRFANAQGPAMRNAANTADLQLPFYDANNDMNAGIGAGSFYPNGDTGLHLGKTTNRFGNLNMAGALNLSGTRTTQAAITVGASPFTYTNADANMETVYIFGGTVTIVSIVRNTTTTQIAITGGSVTLSPGDGVQVTYTAAPTMVKVQF